MSHSLRPFFSVIIIIFSLFIIVFVKMEARRINYSLLRQSRQYQTSLNRYHTNLMKYLEMTQGENINQLAKSKLTLERAKKGQVILLIGGNIAIPQ